MIRNIVNNLVTFPFIFHTKCCPASFFFRCIHTNILILARLSQLKVFTNEKRGGLRVISFDRSPFKLFSRKFSKKSVQAPSCKRPRTAPRTLFVSFASNNCFQIAVYRRSFMKKSVKLACHVVNSNIAIVSLPTLQTSHGLLALFEKIYHGDPIFAVFSNNGEDVQYRCFN
jgi:hypothetical protein